MYKLQYLATCSYIPLSKHINFKQNIQKNRLKIKELLERKIGEKKSKIGSSLAISHKVIARLSVECLTAYTLVTQENPRVP